MITIMYTFIAHRCYRHTGKTIMVSAYYAETLMMLQHNPPNSYMYFACFFFRLRLLVGSALGASGQWTIATPSTAGTNWIRVLSGKRLGVGATYINWCQRSHIVQIDTAYFRNTLYTYMYVLCIVYCVLRSYAAQYQLCLKLCWHNVRLPTMQVRNSTLCIPQLQQWNL